MKRGLGKELFSKSFAEENVFIVDNVKVEGKLNVNFNKENYDSWTLRRQGFFEMFPIEVYPYVANFEPLFQVKDMQHPILLKEYLGGRISLETLIILDELVEYTQEWNIKLKGDVVWEPLKELMKNYKGFLTIDAKRYRIKLLNLIEESS